MAKGMTTDVYPRDNCIAPDIAFIVWTTNTTSACARVGVASGGDGRMIVDRSFRARTTARTLASPPTPFFESFGPQFLQGRNSTL